MRKTEEMEAWMQSLGGGTVAIYAKRFTADGFHPSAFHDHGIARPPTIAASVVQRQAEFFFGRLAARHALAVAGFPTSDIGIGASRAPVFPAGVRGSITHTRDFAAAVAVPAALCAGVGIDMEPWLAAPALASIETIALRASERTLLAQQTQLPYAVGCTLAFSAKESFYKAVSHDVGYVFEFSALHLDAIDLAHRQARFSVTENLSPAWPAGKTCTVDFRLTDADEVFTGFMW